MITAPIYRWLLPLYYFTLSLYSILSTQIFSFGIKVPFDLFHEITSASFWKANYFLWFAALSFLVGAYVGKATIRPSLTSRRGTAGDFFGRRAGKYIIVFNIFVLLFYVSGFGPENLLSRRGYGVYELPRIDLLL